MIAANPRPLLYVSLELELTPKGRHDNCFGISISKYVCAYLFPLRRRDR